MINTIKLFPIKIPEDAEGVVPQSIKWKVGTSSYEIHMVILKSIEMKDVVPHSVKFQSQVLGAVPVPFHQVHSLYTQFPRTLSGPLQAVWDNIISEAEADEEVDTQETDINFQTRLKEFIAAHATEHDRHDLIDQITHPTKPRDLSVQMFLYRLRELNTFVNWLPGTEPAINENALKQALYDGMPITWKNRYGNAGKTVNSQSLAEVIHYFRKQETMALQKSLDNDQRQHENGRIARRKNKNGAPKPYNNGNQSPGHFKRRANRQFENKADNKKAKQNVKPIDKKRKISIDDECPLHPGTGHKWGNCFEMSQQK
jgi:hypothetical protein